MHEARPLGKAQTPPCRRLAQGDPPDSLRHFWRMLLRKNLPRDCLAHLAVAVFGLGDSSYPKYNVRRSSALPGPAPRPALCGLTCP